MADSEPKSAYELAMERLRKKDAEEGVEHRPLSEQQRAEIAEVRSLYDAKVAESEILHASEKAKATDFEALEKLEEEYRRDRQRLSSERESRIEKLRSGGS